MDGDAAGLSMTLCAFVWQKSTPSRVTLFVSALLFFIYASGATCWTDDSMHMCCDSAVLRHIGSCAVTIGECAAVGVVVVVAPASITAASIGTGCACNPWWHDQLDVGISPE